MPCAILQPRDGTIYALRGETVTIVAYPDHRIELLHGTEILPFKVFDPVRSVAVPVDDKTLNARVDDALNKRGQPKPKPKPAASHPWRHPFESPSSGAGRSASP